MLKRNEKIIQIVFSLLCLYSEHIFPILCFGVCAGMAGDNMSSNEAAEVLETKSLENVDLSIIECSRDFFWNRELFQFMPGTTIF